MAAPLAYILGLNSVGGLVIGIVFLAIIFLYPCFWAIRIRSALAVQLYRNQALGISLISAFLIFGTIDNTGTIYSLAILLVFYWIDVSMAAARRSDPLLRDPIHWRSLRLVLWPIVGVGLFASDVSYFYVVGGVIGELTGLIEVIAYIAIPICGVALFAVASRRTRDSNLKHQIEWLGLFAIIQFATILAASVNSILGATYFIGFAIGGFFLYKSARALAPLNHFSTDQ